MMRVRIELTSTQSGGRSVVVEPSTSTIMAAYRNALGFATASINGVYAVYAWLVDELAS